MEIKKINFAIILLMFLFLIKLVSAVPPIPDKFIGTVKINDQYAPLGTEIKIYVNDEFESTTTTTVVGEYSLYVKTGNSGNEIKFKVNDIEAATYNRTGGKTTNLDLAVTIESPPPPEDSSSGNSGGGSSRGGGGSSGGGGGGGGAFFTCNMDWQCGEWSDCIKGVQTRECSFVKVAQHTSKETCPSKDKPPLVLKECKVAEKIEKNSETKEVNEDTKTKEINEANPITGMAISEVKGKPNKSIGIISVIIIVALGSLLYYLFFGTKNEQ